MPSTTDRSVSRQLVVFELDGSPYGLPIEQVQEIIRYTRPRHVASESVWIEGVISLRGKIIPVCDLGARIGVPHERAENANIVIVDTDAGPAGVIVDGVDEVITAPGDAIDSVPGASDPAIEGIAKLDDRLIVLLDPVALFMGLDAVAA